MGVASNIIVLPRPKRLLLLPFFVAANVRVSIGTHNEARHFCTCRRRQFQLGIAVQLGSFFCQLGDHFFSRSNRVWASSSSSSSLLVMNKNGRAFHISARDRDLLAVGRVEVAAEILIDPLSLPLGPPQTPSFCTFKPIHCTQNIQRALECLLGTWRPQHVKICM